jgi:hypothetical protein
MAVPAVHARKGNGGHGHAGANTARSNDMVRHLYGVPAPAYPFHLGDMPPPVYGKSTISG